MSFLNNFESKQDGVNDTVEFVVRVAIVTLSAVILVVVLALVVGIRRACRTAGRPEPQR